LVLMKTLRISLSSPETVADRQSSLHGGSTSTPFLPSTSGDTTEDSEPQPPTPTRESETTDSRKMNETDFSVRVKMLD